MKNLVKHIDVLDQLRGVAILAVLLFHTLGTVFGYDELPWKGCFRDYSTADSFLYFLPISLGNIGVPVFFVVSGFCIHLSFQSQGQAWGSFFIRRFFRIFPAYLVALIFFISLYMRYYQLNFFSWEVWHQLLMHLGFIHNFQNTTIGEINGSFWSIAIEAQLYLLYPMLLFLVRRLSWRRTLICLAVMEMLIRASHGWIDTMSAEQTWMGQISWKLTVSPLGYWFSWAVGAWLADAFIKNLELPFKKHSVVGWFFLAMGSYFVRPLDAFRFLWIALATVTWLSQSLSAMEAKNKTPLFSLGIMKSLGLWSYSLYLIHQPLLQNYSYLINWLVPVENRTPVIACLLNLAAWIPIIALSYLWFQLFELPGIALGKKVVKRWSLRGVSELKSKELLVPIFTEVWPTRAVGKMCLLVGLVALASIISVKLIPCAPGANNNLAWSLATNPNPSQRDGVRAVALAENACARTQYKETIYLGTLAAAYATAGRFDAAVNMAQRACELAQKNGETNLWQRNQALLERYRRHEMAE